MRINEIFYSIQGEGAFTGTPAVFVRFSGCNLKCDFCDTLHQVYTEMSVKEIIEEIKKYPAKHVVLTGGEPTMQVTEHFLEQLKKEGCFIQIETNGTNFVESENIDWVTCSPKYKEPVLDEVDELKVVYQCQDMGIYDHIQARHRYLQPCDTKNKEANQKNLDATIDYILKPPEWKLSLQTQKILDIR